jgi:hypothetical protein
MTITGRWRIVEMELWDSDDLDLSGPAFIEFGEDGLGRQHSEITWVRGVSRGETYSAAGMPGFV